MPETLQIRAATKDDRALWEGLWRRNCTHHGAAGMSDSVVEGLWERILDPAAPVSALLAETGDDPPGPAGLVHYILHPHTFSLKPVCYLEDLWVDPAARNAGVGRRLIAHLEALGRASGWRRIYWVTESDNAPARALYDRMARQTEHVQYRIDLDR